MGERKVYLSVCNEKRGTLGTLEMIIEILKHLFRKILLLENSLIIPRRYDQFTIFIYAILIIFQKGRKNWIMNDILL